MRDALDIVHMGRWEWDIGADKLHLSEDARQILVADVATEELKLAHEGLKYSPVA